MQYYTLFCATLGAVACPKLQRNCLLPVYLYLNVLSAVEWLFKIILLCLAETWLSEDNYVSSNEVTPSSHTDFNAPCCSCQGDRVTAIFDSYLSSFTKPNIDFSTCPFRSGSAFDTIDHLILLQRLENQIGINGTALNCLSDRHHFVDVNHNSSMLTKVSYGVPQGSVFGLILFTIYLLPLGNVMRKHPVVPINETLLFTKAYS